MDRDDRERLRRMVGILSWSVWAMDQIKMGRNPLAKGDALGVERERNRKRRQRESEGYREIERERERIRRESPEYVEHSRRRRRERSPGMRALTGTMRAELIGLGGVVERNVYLTKRYFLELV